MKRPNFQENTEVKVVDKDSSFYGKRGTVSQIIGLDRAGYEIAKPYLPKNYPLNWMVDVNIDGEPYSFFDWERQLESVQKKFTEV